MSEQFRVYVGNVVLALQVKFDWILHNVGVNQYPEKLYREIRVGPRSDISREYLFYMNSATPNDVTTSKYNVLSFLPRALFEQFRRVANLYFLFIGVLMAIGTYSEFFDSPLDPWSTLFPLFIVIGVSMAKEAAEDVKRHRGDRETNNCPATILVPDETILTDDLVDMSSSVSSISMHDRLSHSMSYGEDNRVVTTKTVYWSDIQVGDFVYLTNNEMIPADMILLTSSDELSGSGAVYIETANIDGETNLKIRVSALAGVEKPIYTTNRGNEDCKHWFPADVLRSNLVVQCDHPNASIHTFKGSVACDGESIPVDTRHLLLRGSQLCNSAWAIGIVVYTGHQSKLVLNSREVPSKLSFIERIMNTLVSVIFAAHVMVSLISLICYIIWTTYHYDVLGYLCYSQNPNIDPIYENCKESSEYSNLGYFFTFYILFNNFVPISLYVTCETVNYVQAYYIDNDIHMYDSVSNVPTVARTSNMNGDLGMIEYIFSDKTGTLTQNLMIFNSCSVGGIVYCVDTAFENASDDVLAAGHEPLSNLLDLAAISANKPFDLENNNFYSQFALVLAIAHTVVIDPVTNEFMAESPDEEALVKAGRDLGWVFSRREHNSVEVSVPGKVARSKMSDNVMRFKILATIPFDSTRKRMSVIVQFVGCDDAFVLSKGADNIMLDRASNFITGSSEKKLKVHLNEFATKGLRTLILARRRLSKIELDSFLEKWNKAQNSMVARDELLEEAASMVENDFTILGATAIEDKLQDEVPETIEALRIAGIKLWVLTGDKVETAINIGFSCRLLGPEMIIIKLEENFNGSDNSIPALKVRLDKIMSQLKICANTQFNATASTMTSNLPSDGGMVDLAAIENVTLSSEHLALVVDGVMLTKILSSVTLRSLFLELACMCKAVLACRVSPQQKRLLVRLVKTKNKGTTQPPPVTLAIGDGANDVAMIQEAQVGVGISGREGRQAVNNSDFALPQFRFLKRLLLVHGRTDYRRVSKVVLYSFYKNIVLTITIFLFTFHSGLSGQSLYDGYLYSSYNFILALPVVGFGIFDQDLSPRMLEKYPLLYVTSREKRDMNVPIVIRMTLQAVLEGSMIFYTAYGAFTANNGSGDDGLGGDIWVFGTSVYTALIITQVLRCMWLTYTWNVVSVFFILFSVATYFTFLSSYQYFMFFDNFFNVTSHVLQLRIVWVIALLVPITAILIEVFFTALIREFSPDLLSVCIEHDRGYGRKRKSKHDQVSTTVSSPFYESIQEEIGCYFDAEMDTSSATMLQHESRGLSDDAKSDVDDSDEAEEESFMATLLEGLRPRMFTPKEVTEGQKKRNQRSQCHWGCCEGIRLHLLWCFENIQHWVTACISGESRGDGSEGGNGQQHTFRLDWQSVRDMYLKMTDDVNTEEDPSDTGLNLKNTDDGLLRSFNYDFVTTDYGPGAARFFTSAYRNSVGIVVQTMQEKFKNIDKKSDTASATVTGEAPGLDLSSHLQSVRTTKNASSNIKETVLVDDDAILLSFDESESGKSCTDMTLEL